MIRSEVIVRRSIDKESVKDECSIRVGHRDAVDGAKLERLVQDAIERLRDSNDLSDKQDDGR